MVKRVAAVIGAVALLALGSIGASAQGVTAPPPFSVFAPDLAPLTSGAVSELIGEGRAVNDSCGTVGGNCFNQFMDWQVSLIVGGPFDGLFLYEYQFENASFTFTNFVTVGNLATNSELAYVSIGTTAADLDTTAPHVIAGEFEPAIDSQGTVIPVSLIGDGTATWFGRIECDSSNGACGDTGPPGPETIIMTLIGGPPVYVDWATANGSNWSTVNDGCTIDECIKVPGPGVAVPEPASLMLLGLGLVTAGAVVRRRHSRKA